MTISTTDNRANYVGDGVIVQFSFGFRTLDDSHLYAYLDTVAQGSGFTVTRNADQDTSPGGVVDFGIAPATDELVTLERIVPFTQETDYTEYDPFPAETHEAALDTLTMQTQQNNDALARAMKLGVTDDGTTDLTVPAYESLKILQWDAALKKLNNVNPSDVGMLVYSDYMATLFDDVDALEATGTLKTGYVVDDKAEALTLVLSATDAGRKVFITSENDGGAFTVRYNVTPSTYVDNGGTYNGTIIVPTGGDGTIGIVRDYSGAANIQWFGVTGSGTNADPWLGWDTSIQDLVVADILPIKEWYFPHGEYAYSNTWTFDDTTAGQTYRDLRITGLGEVILQFNGTGEASLLEGHASIATVIHLDDIKIKGNANCTNVMRIKRVSRSSFRNIKLEEATDNALIMDFCLLNTIENFSASGNDVGIMVTRPSNGLKLIGQSTANTFINPVIEGVADIGIYLTDGAGANAFMGGTCEAGSGPLKQDYGIKIDALCDRNLFENVFCEDSAVEDILDFGTGSQFINCTGFSPTSPSGRGLHLGGDDESGLALSGGTATIGLAASASAVDDFYVGQAVWLVGGTGSGQKFRIIGYVGSTKTATISQNWATIPDGSSQYQIRGSTQAIVTGGMYEHILVDDGVLRGDFRGAIFGRASASGTFVNNSPSTLISNTYNYQSGSSPTEGGLALTDATGTGVAITMNASVWEKIGRRYFCDFNISFGASASGTAIKLSGLPADVITASLFGGAANYSNYVATGGITFRTIGGTNDFNILDGPTNLTYANMSGKVLAGTIEFRV